MLVLYQYKTSIGVVENRNTYKLYVNPFNFMCPRFFKKNARKPLSMSLITPWENKTDSAKG